MFCIFCQTEETKVVDSRLVSEGRQVRRRRECEKCQERFTTYEYAELIMPKIIKRNGERKAFDEEKLRVGMMRALGKRPVSAEKYEAALARIKSQLLALGEREVDSDLLGEWVMNELRELDEVAYLRFASVYRRFEDLNDFYEELNRLAEHIVDRNPDF